MLVPVFYKLKIKLSMKKFLYFCSVVFFLSCSQQSVQLDENCFDLPEQAGSEYCDSEEMDDKYCDLRYIGKFSLSENSKAFLPEFCYNIGSLISYENESGEEMVFTVVDKGYNETHRIISQGNACEDDSTQVLLDCIDHERAYVRIKSESKTFEIELVTLPDTEDLELGKIGDFLGIHREEVKDYFVNEWVMVVDQRSLSYEQSPCLINHENITLNGKSFQDVLSFDENQDCKNYQYFVNKEQGLIAFKRSDGVLWVQKN